MAQSSSDIKAVLFDLDGTLYHLAPMRRKMMLELAMAPFTEGLGFLRLIRRLKLFRHVREELRELGESAEPLDRMQYLEPALRSGDDPALLEECVALWMHGKPLRHLRGCRRAGLSALLGELKGCGYRLGVFSDYPAGAKVDALGLGGIFDFCLAATDSTVNAFKPHPRGFLRACEVWGLEPAQVLYVGDRDELDGAGARAAGMPVCILGQDGDGLSAIRRVTLTAAP